MKVLFLPLILLFLCFPSLFAQDLYSVKGIIVDKSTDIKLENTTIAVLNSKDSTLAKFTRATANGSFSVNNLFKGKFILLVTYPGYADYVEHFVLDSAKKVLDYGELNMILKARLLADVIVKGKVAAIKIKGDTTEFNAGSFKIEPNSKVEDLLKQLPGIEVDKDGKITAQGQTVNKVLVDGEEFFGDDPTLVTKNLRGDMVDKVQLYDKKSDQATFTGVDDGIKNKTINIKLKEGKKNGYFGKVDGGGASDEYYTGQGMFNAFKAKQKFSAYSTVGNTGKTGLSWQDNNKYGASNNEINEDGDFRFNGGGDDLRYNGQGSPLAQTGGLHYDSKWNKDKESINTNYKIGALSISGKKNDLSQNSLPTGIINSNSDQNFDDYTFRQKLDATYQIKLDSSSSLKIAFDGTLKNSHNENDYLAVSTRDNNPLLNQTDQNSNNGTQNIFNANVFWNKKLKKLGRTVSLNISQSFSKDESTGFSNSIFDFYNKEGIRDSTQHLDQYKTSETNNSVFSSNLTYSEPLSKTFSLIVNYGLGFNNSSSNRKSFNLSAPGEYETLDTRYSNGSEFDRMSNQAGAVFNYKKDKTTINFGTKVDGFRIEQVDIYSKNAFEREFFNWLPQASYQYKFSQQKSFRLEYSGRTSQPSINQIQPLRGSNNPLDITLGNSNLKPSFGNRFNINYNSYKMLSGQSIYLYGSYSFNENSIVNNIVTDSAGKRTSQYVNLTGKNPSNFSFYGGVYRKIGKTDLQIGFNLNTNGNTYFNFTNSVLNTTKSNNYSGELSVSKYKLKKYNFRISMGPNYNTSESSLQKQINNNGWGVNSYASFSVNLPGKVEISSDGNYQFREKTQTFNQDFERVIWNSSISKKFFKAENLKLSISGNDLLNQNVGFNRNAYDTMITQNSYTTIKRYFMTSLTWDFNKMAGGIKSKN